MRLIGPRPPTFLIMSRRGRSGKALYWTPDFMYVTPSKREAWKTTSRTAADRVANVEGGTVVRADL